MAVNIETTGRSPVEAGVLAGEAQLNEPRYEAAFFYALFLRGYPVEKLREDIDVSPEVLARWQRIANRDPLYTAIVERMISYRKEVLAIFDLLVLREMPGTTPTTH